MIMRFAITNGTAGTGSAAADINRALAILQRMGLDEVAALAALADAVLTDASGVRESIPIIAPDGAVIRLRRVH